MYLGMLTWPLIALGWVINLFQRGAASMARLLDILDAQSLLADAGDAARAAAGARRDARSSSATSAFTIPTPEQAREPRWVLRNIVVHGARRRRRSASSAQRRAARAR